MAGANLTAELDNAILDQNADHDMNALRERLRRSKMTMELYCKAGQTTPDEVRAAFRRDAERKMRSILAVQAIAKAEQITVSNAEVDAEYVRLSKLHDTPEAENPQCAQPGRCGLCRDHSEGAAFPDRPRKHHFGCGKGVNYGLFYTAPRWIC